MHRRSHALAALAALAAGCADLPGHRCDPAPGNNACGATGVCEPEGACSFPDPQCRSGRAFGDETPPALAGTCVVRDPCSGSATATVSLEAVQNAAPKASVPDGVQLTTDSLRVDPNDSPTCFGTGLPQFGLLQFDLRPLEGATIVSADLLVTSDEVLSGGMLVAPVLELWTEARTTWNERAAGVPWTTPGPSMPGSVGSAWVPRVTIPSGRVDIPLGTQPQVWIDQPGANAGVVLEVVDTQCDGINLASRTAAAVDTRPALRVSLRCP